MRPLIILDRDGVINIDSIDFIKSPDEWHPIPGSLEAIAKLNQAGYLVAVATNQSGVGRGLFDLAMLDCIHQKMHKSLAQLGGKIDLIVFCPHHPDEQCDCRKPKPGLLHNILRHFSIDTIITPVLVIGDSLRDLEAARAPNCEPILVLTGHGKETHKMLPVHLQEIKIYTHLADAVDILLSKHKKYVPEPYTK